MHRVPELAAQHLAETGTGSRTQARAEVRGLLHDLGHGLATLSLLTGGLAADPALPAESRDRLELVDQEVNRLLELLSRSPHEADPEEVDVRDLLDQLVSLVSPATSTTVTLLPGPEVNLHVDPVMFWRMVANLVDNAVRAAGDDGNVQISVTGGSEPSVEVVDDGPGFGRGAGGVASVGLGVVTGLARKCGGALRMRPVAPTGTSASLVFTGAG